MTKPKQHETTKVWIGKKTLHFEHGRYYTFWVVEPVYSLFYDTRNGGPAVPRFHKLRGKCEINNAGRVWLYVARPGIEYMLKPRGYHDRLFFDRAEALKAYEDALRRWVDLYSKHQQQAVRWYHRAAQRAGKALSAARKSIWGRG